MALPQDEAHLFHPFGASTASDYPLQNFASNLKIVAFFGDRVRKQNKALHGHRATPHRQTQCMNRRSYSRAYFGRVGPRLIHSDNGFRHVSHQSASISSRTERSIPGRQKHSHNGRYAQRPERIIVDILAVIEV
jgi:hypothetical protein